jgi:hypothetical protein
VAQGREVFMSWLLQHNCLFGLRSDSFIQSRRPTEASVRGGQGDGKSAAAFVGMAQIDSPIVRFGDPARDGKPKPSAAAIGLL